MLSLNLSNKAIQDFFFLLEIVREEKGIKKSVIGAPAQNFQFLSKCSAIVQKGTQEHQMLLAVCISLNAFRISFDIWIHRFSAPNIMYVQTHPRATMHAIPTGKISELYKGTHCSFYSSAFSVYSTDTLAIPHRIWIQVQVFRSSFKSALSESAF